MAAIGYQTMLWEWSSLVRQRKIRVALFTLLFGSLMAGLTPEVSSASDADLLESKIKAAMLYKFLDYIEWPPTAFPSDSSPYTIAVIGADAIATELREITSRRTVKDRSVRIIEVGNPQALVEGVHMLFIGRDEGVQQVRMVEFAQQYSIVTVTENQSGLHQGSVINLRLADGRIHFDISLEATKTRNLKVSARMLSVASSVKRGVAVD